MTPRSDPSGEPPRITDTHCHLDFPQLAGELPDVLARARAAGVARVVTICTKLREAPRVAAIAEAHPAVWWAAGTHPMSAAAEPMATVEDLVRLAEHPKLVAVGESGLDYHYTAESAGAQAESLRVHCEAARRTGLPLIIHARDADEDMARILTEEHRAGAFSCVMHCFSSGEALARAALDLGFFLSMSGIAAFPRSEGLRELFAAAPLDRVVVETDSPYLAPPPHRGKRCEPAHAALTARAGAETMGLAYPAFAAATEANAEALYPRMGPPPAADPAPDEAAGRAPA